jgi:hypothetical protein
VIENKSNRQILIKSIVSRQNKLDHKFFEMVQLFKKTHNQNIIGIIYKIDNIIINFNEQNCNHIKAQSFKGRQAASQINFIMSCEMFRVETLHYYSC